MQITVQDAQIDYNRRGTGMPTLFLHGVPDSAEMWNGVIDRLQAICDCIAPDLPGLTTRSQVPAGFDFTLSSMAGFIDALVTALNLTLPINLVFGDFGALYGLTWAITHPEKVGKIVLAGSVGFSPDYQWHSTAKLWRTPLLGDLSMISLSESMFKNAMKSSAPLLTPDHWHDVYARSMASGAVKRNVLRQYRAIDPKQFAVWQPKLLELTKRIPMIVLWGDQDPFIPSRFADTFGAREVHHYPNNGHWIAVEAPEEIAAKIAAFFG